MLSRSLLTLSCSVALALACGGDAKKDTKKDTKVEAKTDAKADPDATKRNDSTSLDKAVASLDLSGAVPPEASAILFSIDGALIPIGCFDKAKNKLLAGKDCLALAKAGEEVYLRDKSEEKLEKFGPVKNPMCQPDPVAVSTAATDAGQAFEYAVYPKSIAKLFTKVSEESWSERGRGSVTDDEKKALAALANAAGDLQVNQATTFDVDSDGKPDKFASIYMVDPKDSEKYSFSGVFLQRGSDPSRWVSLHEAKNDTEAHKLLGFVDLNGDKSFEIWINATTTDGAGGDRVLRLKEGGAEPLGKWSCGL